MLPDPLAVFNRPAFKGIEEGRAKEKGKGWRGSGRERK